MAHTSQGMPPWSSNMPARGGSNPPCPAGIKQSIDTKKIRWGGGGGSHVCTRIRPTISHRTTIVTSMGREMGGGDCNTPHTPHMQTMQQVRVVQLKLLNGPPQRISSTDLINRPHQRIGHNDTEWTQRGEHRTSMVANNSRAQCAAHNG